MREVYVHRAHGWGPLQDPDSAMIEANQVQRKERGGKSPDDMDGNHEAWVRRSDPQEERKRLSAALKGWWKLARPFKTWGLYRKVRVTSEANRKAANERFLRKRLGDPALANLNEDQRRAVIVGEDRTLTLRIVAGREPGEAHRSNAPPQPGAPGRPPRPCARERRRSARPAARAP